MSSKGGGGKKNDVSSGKKDKSQQRVQYHVQTKSGRKDKKPITKLALEGEFTYSQACLDNSTASGSTVILPSIAITHASPSKSTRECSSDQPNARQNDKEQLICTSARGTRSNSKVSSDNEVIIDFTDPSKSNLHPIIKTVSKKSSTSSQGGENLLSPNNLTYGNKTQYFNDDELRSTIKGVIFPKLTDNFNDKHLEAAYQRYSHRQRQKSLLILHILDIVLKMLFYIALVIRIKESSGRIRVPMKELFNILPWIVSNSLTIGLITCWKKCANNYLHLAALLTCAIFNFEGMSIHNWPGDG